MSVQANLLRDTDGKQILSFPEAILRHWKISKKKLAQTYSLYLPCDKKVSCPRIVSVPSNTHEHTHSHESTG